jgi:hypothetical protein
MAEPTRKSPEIERMLEECFGRDVDWEFDPDANAAEPEKGE